jgi:formylglycine-generating enzyme required for sulfatase activity
VSGTCSVGITGNSNFFGSETLGFTVSNAQTSNSAALNITIDNVNDAPVISDVTNQTTNEDTDTSSVAFTINDIDSSLSCSSSVAMSSSNTTLISNANIAFSGTAPNCQAVLTPNANESGTSTITLTLSDGSLSTTDSFLLTVSAVDDPADVAEISSLTILQGSSNATLVDASDVSGGDTDVEGQALTYACNFDLTPDDSISGGLPCNTSNLPGLSFNTATGVVTYNAAYNAPAGIDIQILAGDNGVANDDDTIFTVTITDVDFAPELATISDVSATNGSAITTINIGDTHTGNDTDRDSETITYSCGYDQVDDNSVTPTTNCNSGVDGFTFSTTTGELGGTPSSDGIYEFKIIATAGSNSDTTIFTITVNPAGPPGIAASEEWIQVPANAGGIGLPLFWVMKYEAKAWNDSNTNNTIDGGEIDTDGINGSTDNWGNATHKPVSIADNQPWREIDANGAAAECESLGSNYHLITNDEWMAIARDAENEADNWTGNSVGTGCLFRGNSGETTTGDGNGGSDSCGYNGADPEQGTGRDIRAKLKLSNGEEIYDLAANVLEWTDWDDPTTSPTAGFQLAPDTSSCSHGELTSVAASCGGILAPTDYDTDNGTFTRTQGVGYFAEGSGSAALRGGSWVDETVAGAFSLYLFSGPSNSNFDIGFRCVYRP